MLPLAARMQAARQQALQRILVQRGQAGAPGQPYPPQDDGGGGGIGATAPGIIMGLPSKIALGQRLYNYFTEPTTETGAGGASGAGEAAAGGGSVAAEAGTDLASLGAEEAGWNAFAGSPEMGAAVPAAEEGASGALASVAPYMAPLGVGAYIAYRALTDPHHLTGINEPIAMRDEIPRVAANLANLATEGKPNSSAQDYFEWILGHTLGSNYGYDRSNLTTPQQLYGQLTRTGATPDSLNKLLGLTNIQDMQNPDFNVMEFFRKNGYLDRQTVQNAFA